uniref:Uncharacterized protein n=1 Tax=Aegilops tauschii subsp. strangulata TaxID=200361 RepID=A0A453PFM0_AEGTS
MNHVQGEFVHSDLEKNNFGTLQLLKAMMEIPCSPGRKATSSSCTTSWGSPGFTFVQRLAQ